MEDHHLSAQQLRDIGMKGFGGGCSVCSVVFHRVWKNTQSHAFFIHKDMRFSRVCLVEKGSVALFVGFFCDSLAGRVASTWKFPVDFRVAF